MAETMNKKLTFCPACLSKLDDAALVRMGNRTGFALNAFCPGSNGPGDIDHLIHNEATHRVAAFEYKRDTSGGLPEGQRRLLDDIGNCEIRYWVIANNDLQGALTAYAEAAGWVWPDHNPWDTFALQEGHAIRRPIREMSETDKRVMFGVPSQ